MWHRHCWRLCRCCWHVVTLRERRLSTSESLSRPEQTGLCLCAGAGKEARVVPADVLLLASCCAVKEADLDVACAERACLRGGAG